MFSPIAQIPPLFPIFPLCCGTFPAAAVRRSAPDVAAPRGGLTPMYCEKLYKVKAGAAQMDCSRNENIPV